MADRHVKGASPYHCRARTHAVRQRSDRHKLPVVYCERSFVAAGGLIFYGPNYVDHYRQAAGYVDRIVRG